MNTDYLKFYKPKTNITCMSLSNDGNQILYSSNKNGSYQLFTFNMGSGAIQQLTFNSEVSYLAVSYVLNDNAVIYQCDSGDEINNLYLFDLISGKIVALTNQVSEKVRFLMKADEYHILFKIKDKISIFNLHSLRVEDSIDINHKVRFLNYLIDENKWVLYKVEEKKVYVKESHTSNYIIYDIIGNPITSYENKFLCISKNKDSKSMSLSVYDSAKHQYSMLLNTYKRIYHAEIGHKTVLCIFRHNHLFNIVLIDIKSGSILKEYNETNNRRLINFAFDKRNEYLLLSWDTIRSQSEIILYSFSSNSEIVINMSSKESNIGIQPKQVMINSNLDGYLYKPSNKTSGAILYLHGGPSKKAEATYNTLIQFFVNAGWIVLDINYHGSSGHGIDFENSINGNIGVLELQDCIDSYYYLRKFVTLPNQRIGICGESYGGFLTLLCLQKHSKLFDFGVSLNGVLDWYHALTEIPAFWKNKVEFMYKKFGDPKINYEHLMEISPINNYKSINVPVIIFQSSNDPRVPSSITRRFYSLLKPFNNKTELVIFEADGHEISLKINQHKLYDKLYNFLNSRELFQLDIE